MRVTRDSLSRACPVRSFCRAWLVKTRGTYYIYNIHVKGYLHFFKWYIHLGDNLNSDSFPVVSLEFFIIFPNQTCESRESKYSFNRYLHHPLLLKKAFWLVYVMVTLQVGRTSFLGSRSLSKKKKQVGDTRKWSCIINEQTHSKQDGSPEFESCLCDFDFSSYKPECYCLGVQSDSRQWL